MCSEDCGTVINVDVNGAMNIAKKYQETQHSALNLSAGRPVVVLGTTKMYRFDGCSFVA